MKKTIWTVGHSNKSIEEFILMLQSFEIKILADIRRFPGSKKFPHFNKEALEASLRNEGIVYKHIESLGGRRKPKKDSTNMRWKNEAFRGYADYMESRGFKTAIQQLMNLANTDSTAMMCSEVLWWQCHRSLVSDYLKSEGWTVWHIMGVKNSREHPFSPAARIVQGKLDYSNGFRNKE